MDNSASQRILMQLASHRISLPDHYSGIETKKVLLVEDDEAFKEVLGSFFESHFFDVTAVSSGVDGVREIMKCDYDVIVCDMMMPGLPGDMFYFAVERIKAHLCSRFIFITGMRGKPKIIEFIKRVNGTILWKPFHSDDLLEVVEFVQRRAGQGGQ